MDIQNLNTRVRSVEKRLNSTRYMLYNSYPPNYYPYDNNQPGRYSPWNSYNRGSVKNLKEQVLATVRKELKNEQLKSKTDEPSSLWIGIWDKTPISDERLVELKRAILLKIMKEFTNGAGPSFSCCEFKTGWLQVACKNASSLDWMKKIVPLLKPWYDAELQVKICESLPKVNAIVLHASTSEANTCKEAIALLKAQNPTLKVDKWELFHVETGLDTLLVYFNVSDECIDDLCKIKFKPSFGFTNAYVEISTRTKSECEIVPAVNDTEVSIVGFNDDDLIEY